MPLCVLDSSEEEDFWVLEMAMRGHGEIAYLAEIAKPHVGLITNVAAAHLERLGSIDEVARAKGEIFQHLAGGGIAVFPADDERIERQAADLPEERKRRFGTAGSQRVSCHVRILEFVPAGENGSLVRMSVGYTPVTVRLPLAGEHNARNAAAALAVASACLVPAVEAAARLGTASLPAHRSRLLSVAGRVVMDDCYNANPTSMSAALKAVITSAGSAARAFAVLGDMLEVGADTAKQHEALGREVANLRFAGLAAVGELAAHIANGARAAGLARQQVLATLDPELVASTVADWSRPGDWILIKASRGTRLERVLEALQRKLES
jgi:UDP-N-acetylmuramoyl-tripeptide--D-alanyl-D-alanine ligase